MDGGIGVGSKLAFQKLSSVIFTKESSLAFGN
jgi:hypothetical protein